jgi:outer membrane protein OmpA-like peptidoglycan-associated protein
MRTIGFLPLILLPLACASTAPSPELVDARRAYDEARVSRAATYGPDRLLVAKQALDRAESAHRDDANSFEERRLAYVARRKAEYAKAYGNYAMAKRDQEVARKTYMDKQDRLRREAEATAETRTKELEDTRETLSSAQSRIATQQTDIQKSKAELASEREARERAEQNAAAAVASLRELAQIKEDSRGTIITLDGAVLFVTAKAELLPLAKQKLDEVAKALTDLDAKQTITVEGHTDSRGADDMNQKLSEDRANAVRAYLVERGVKPERIKAVGRGESTPITSNDTPEGRANNRRVEIVIGKG